MRTMFVSQLLLVASSAAAEEASLEQFFDQYIHSYADYFAAGEDADISVVMAHFHEPTMMVPPRGSPAVANTRADLSRNFVGFLQMLRGKGTVRLEWERLQLVHLGPNNAIGSNIARALDADGNVVDRRSSVYSIYRTENGWQIAMIQSHAVETVPELSPGV